MFFALKNVKLFLDILEYVFISMPIYFDSIKHWTEEEEGARFENKNIDLLS